MAKRLKGSLGCLKFPLANIERWLAQDHSAPHRLKQWRQIILEARASGQGWAACCRFCATPAKRRRICARSRLSRSSHDAGAKELLEQCPQVTRPHRECGRALVRRDRRIVGRFISLLACFRSCESDGPLDNPFDASYMPIFVKLRRELVLHEAIGENSIFQSRTGYYADILRPAVSETFPRGWEELVPLPGCDAARCLDPHDLAAVKMQAGRAKDLALCVELLAAGKLKAELIRERCRRHG